MGCHTTAGGAEFAGGRGIDTPFGVVVAPNITPDVQDRHRPLVGKRVLAQPAPRALEGRSPLVPGLSVSELHPGFT
jgi:hypothetical protein